MSIEGVSEFVEEKLVTPETVRRVDQLGVYVSAACAVHCLSLPVLLAAIPTVGSIMYIGEGIEVILAIGAVLLAVACLCWGFRIHRKKRLFLTFTAALVFIVWGQLFAEGWWEVALVVTGAAGLVGSHLLNRKLCLGCHDCADHQH